MTRTVRAVVPPEVTYAITVRGQEAIPCILALQVHGRQVMQWEDAHLRGGGQPH